VENERARLTQVLAKIKEDQGKLSEAAEILQEIQVETYGTMEKKEKTDFILEQVRLCLDSNDFVRAQILSKKISKKALDDKDFQEQKLRYFQLMIRFYNHEQDYLEICRSYMAIYDTPIVKEDKEKLQHNLKRVCLFIVLAKHGNEQNDLLNRIFQDKNLDLIPSYRWVFPSILFLSFPLTHLPLTAQAHTSHLTHSLTLTHLHSHVHTHTMHTVPSFRPSYSFSFFPTEPF
jgi:26S proteasome regulatory subunit N5